jgi:hypothetical protein
LTCVDQLPCLLFHASSNFSSNFTN